MAPHPAVDALDPSVVEFITSHLSIHVAAVTDQCRPTLVRALGCCVNEAGTEVRLLLPSSRSGPLLRALASNQRIAAVFSHPENNRTLQLKGIDARIELPSASERAMLAPYISGFAAKVERFNVPEIFIRTLCDCPPDDLVVVCFTPLTGYRQTPGLGAGDPMPLGAPLP